MPSCRRWDASCRCNPAAARAPLYLASAPLTSLVHPSPRRCTPTIYHRLPPSTTIYHHLPPSTTELQAQLHAQTDAAEAAARREAESEEAMQSLRAGSTDLEVEIAALRSEMAQREEEFQVRAVAILSRRRTRSRRERNPASTCDGPVLTMYDSTYDLPGRAQPLHREARRSLGRGTAGRGRGARREGARRPNPYPNHPNPNHPTPDNVVLQAHIYFPFP